MSKKSVDRMIKLLTDIGVLSKEARYKKNEKISNMYYIKEVAPQSPYLGTDSPYLGSESPIELYPVNNTQNNYKLYTAKRILQCSSSEREELLGSNYKQQMCELFQNKKKYDHICEIQETVDWLNANDGQEYKYSVAEFNRISILINRGYSAEMILEGSTEGLDYLVGTELNDF